jgi:3-oxoadipate enol-lactonase
MNGALVFIHGIGGDGRAWAAQEAHFAGRGATLAWDVPGYAGKPMLNEMSFETIAANLIQDLDVAGMDQVVLVGHSFGGMVAQAVVHDFPGRVARLVLCGTSPSFGRPDGDFQRKFIADRLAPLDAGKTLSDIAPETMRRFEGDNADPAGLALGIECMSAVPEATYRTVLQLIAGFNMKDALGAISCPTLLVAAEKDNAAPAKMMARMAEAIPGARYVEMAGAGHMMALERPQQFNAILDDFLKETAQ